MRELLFLFSYSSILNLRHLLFYPLQCSKSFKFFIEFVVEMSKLIMQTLLISSFRLFFLAFLHHTCLVFSFPFLSFFIFFPSLLFLLVLSITFLLLFTPSPPLRRQLRPPSLHHLLQSHEWAPELPTPCPLTPFLSHASYACSLHYRKKVYDSSLNMLS